MAGAGKRGRITAAHIAEARALFEEIAGPALRSLPPAEAGLERARLFGSAVGSGIVDRVFAMEAERGSGIRERLMEYELDGDFTFTGEDGVARDVRLRAKIDRVDLLDDGTFRLIDYKTKYVPDRRQALQLPIYSACVRTSLARTHGRDIPASEAMYLSFEGPQAVVPLEERGKLFEELTTSAGHRLVAALDDIAAGHYPPRPETKNLCTMCAFVAVCRHPGGAKGAQAQKAQKAQIRMPDQVRFDFDAAPEPRRRRPMRGRGGWRSIRCATSRSRRRRAPARRACSSIATCGCSKPASRRATSWRSPSRARPRRKCASA